MMNSDVIERLISSGGLNECIQALETRVKNAPQDITARSGLFEALCFRGDLERAEKHLEAMTKLGAKRLDVLLSYKLLIEGEKQRRKVFSGEKTPIFPGSVSQSANLRLDALKALARGDQTAFQEIYSLAVKNQQTISCLYNNEPQAVFRDYDDLLGPVFEFINQAGQYCWIEQQHLQKITPLPMEDWIDSLWRAVLLELTTGQSLQGYLPVIYQATTFSDQEDLLLGKMTDWQVIGKNIYRGLGQRLFLVGESEVPAYELETVVFQQAPPIA